MYRHCLFCSGSLGRNDVVPVFPMGRRLAFDPARGRLWVICEACDRWNLVPIEERWEAVEECERLFRATRLRFSTANIGLAQLPGGMALIRVGPALKPELAAWRYGRYLRRWLPSGGQAIGFHVSRSLDRAIGAVAGQLGVRRRYDVATWLRLRLSPDRVLALVDTSGERVVVRVRHLETATLQRPDPGEGWRLTVRHDAGVATLSGESGLGVAGKLLARLNGRGAPDRTIEYAVSKLDDAANPAGYFARVAAIALRSWWGRRPEIAASLVPADPSLTEAEALALNLTRRSFWGRGGLGSEPATPLPRLPLVDRLALEMAANEDTERRVLEGELRVLERAWREADMLAVISDDLPCLAAAPTIIPMPA